MNLEILKLICNKCIYYIRQQMRFWYLLHCQMSRLFRTFTACIHYIKYGGRGRLRSKFRPLAVRDTSACMFKGVFCACANSTRISCVGPYIILQASYNIEADQTVQKQSLTVPIVY